MSKKTGHATLFGGGSCLRLHCDVARCRLALSKGKGPNGITFSGGSFSCSKLLGCHSNWPGAEQSGLLPGICQRRGRALHSTGFVLPLSALFSPFSFFLLFYVRTYVCMYRATLQGHPREAAPSLPAKEVSCLGVVPRLI